MVKYSILFLLFIGVSEVSAQSYTLSGSVLSIDKPVEFANVYIIENGKGTVTNAEGYFEIASLKPGKYTVRVSYIGFKTQERKVSIIQGQDNFLKIQIYPLDLKGDEIVVTSTLKEITRSENPVPIEVFSPVYFKMNPTPSLYDALQNVNGVRPQLNCSVCNTGDIHINGLEGPYTMVLIDGMPIVSGLSTVYGLSGIPNSIIERVEIVKGPSSTLYGSEAVGGLINVITKKPSSASKLVIDGMSSNWYDMNFDIGAKFKAGNKTDFLTGINIFNYTNPIDNNRDGFTDVTIQQRVSIFQKITVQRKKDRLLTMGGRYLYEDRWGGELNWTDAFKGGVEVYGETITTNRVEFISNYQLPIDEKILLSVSYNNHNQRSYYGNTKYDADQRISFGQLLWDKVTGINSFIVGLALRYTYYDDNTPATARSTNSLENNPSEVWLPGIFIQNNISLTNLQKLLLGIRYDHDSRHGNIWTPRIAYKWSPNYKNTFRINLGSGFRVVNLFTEDHAALTGAREVVISEELSPERSLNANINYEFKSFSTRTLYFGMNVTAWFTYFDNQILPDYETNSNQIIYENLDGFGVTQGLSLNLDFEFKGGMKLMIGASYIDVYTKENNKKFRPLLTEKWTGTWALGIPIKNSDFKIDYTGNLYGPMRLPVLSDLDPRPSTSPWWSLQNLQITWNPSNSKFKIFLGIKNLLNFTPPSNSIARSFDPFDRNVIFNQDGEVIPTELNPNALIFDPSYVYAPNQGIRGFIGFKYMIQ